MDKFVQVDRYEVKIEIVDLFVAFPFLFWGLFYFHCKLELKEDYEVL